MIPLFNFKKPKKPSLGQAYMSLFSDTFKPLAEAALAEHMIDNPDYDAGSNWLKFINTLATDTYNALDDDDIKDQVKFFRENGHARGVEPPPTHPLTPDGYME
jgi:hypothetical protein